MLEKTKPTPLMYHVGDTVIITGREPKYIGLKAQILDFRYLPSSRRKGYYDYIVDLEILDPPYQGKRLSLIQGNIKLAKHIPEGFLEERRQSLAAKKQSEAEGARKARVVLKIHPEILNIACTENMYSPRIEAIANTKDMSWVELKAFHRLLRAKLRGK